MSRPAIKCSITPAGCASHPAGYDKRFTPLSICLQMERGFLRLEADLDKRLKTIEHALYSGGLTGKLDELI